MADIILLSGNRLNGGFWTKKLQYGADRLIVVDWHEQPAVRGDVHIRQDIKDAPAVLAALADLKVRDILFSFTISDVGVPTQVAIHEAYGLRHPPREAVETCLRKAQMVARWRDAGLLNRESAMVEDTALVRDWLERGDVIVKPNFAYSSLGITVLPRGSPVAAVEPAVARARHHSADHVAIVEEYITGTEFTVEMLGDGDGHVQVYGISKKYHTPYNPTNRIATKLHYNAADVPDALVQRIAEHGIRCYQALGLGCSLGHLELMVAEDGRISPLEMGARSSGYIASHLVDEFNPEPFMLAYARVLRGARLEPGYGPKRDISSMWFFYDLPPGTAQATCDLCQFLPPAIRSLESDREQIHAGQQFAVIDADNQRYGFEILSGPRDILTADRARRAEREFLAVLMGRAS